MTSESLTVRGDGEIVGRIHVGSQSVLHEDETFRRGEANAYRRRSHNKGEWYTAQLTLRERLHELAGFERGDALYQSVKDCDIVTIRDEYRY